MVFGGRLQILPDGQKIHVCGAHVVHHLQDPLTILAQTHHDAGFGEHRGVEFLDLLQQAQAGEIARTGADFGVEAGHGFQIVVEHIRAGLDHFFQRRRRAFQKIGGQDFNGGRRAAMADRADCHGEMLGTAIFQIVAVDRGDHHMVQPQFRHRMRHPARLEGVQSLRPAGRHVAKRAAARAYLAHDHHGGVALRPAFADIGAARLFADRHQLFVA